jgi:hypothetical protein
LILRALRAPNIAKLGLLFVCIAFGFQLSSELMLWLVWLSHKLAPKKEKLNIFEQ